MLIILKSKYDKSNRILKLTDLWLHNLNVSDFEIILCMILQDICAWVNENWMGEMLNKTEYDSEIQTRQSKLGWL